VELSHLFDEILNTSVVGAIPHRVKNLQFFVAIPNMDDIEEMMTTGITDRMDPRWAKR